MTNVSAGELFGINTVRDDCDPLRWNESVKNTFETVAQDNDVRGTGKHIAGDPAQPTGHLLIKHTELGTTQVQDKAFLQEERRQNEHQIPQVPPNSLGNAHINYFWLLEE